MTKAAILVVEDEQAQRRLVADILKRDGHMVAEAASVDEALALMDASIPDLVLCDWRMPERDGGELLKEVKDRGLECSVIVMTAYGSIAHAVEAVRLGAADYLAKPFEREALRLAVQRVLKTRSLEVENRRLRSQASQAEGYGELIGKAPSMQLLYRTMQKVAATEATVLIAGESGTCAKAVESRGLDKFRSPPPRGSIVRDRNSYAAPSARRSGVLATRHGTEPSESAGQSASFSSSPAVSHTENV